jgi:hypothetical protein
LDQLGYVYETYDVRAGASNQKKEPWTFVQGDSLLYDYIVWFTGPLDGFGMRDTAQLNLQDYIDKGGKVWVAGDGLVRDLRGPDPSDPGFDDKQGAFGLTAKDYFGVEVATPISEAGNSFHTTRTLDIALAADFDGVAGIETPTAMNDCPVLASLDSVTIEADEAGFDHEVFSTYTNGNAAGSLCGTITTVNTIVGKTGKVVWTGYDLTTIRSSLNRLKLVHEVLVGVLGVPAPNGLSTGSPTPQAGMVYSLAQNAPNPFNPRTEINFSLASKAPVRLEVFNIMGQVVRTLVNEERSAGSYQVAWDGLNDTGESVTSGVYFYKLNAGDFTETRKMVLVR